MIGSTNAVASATLSLMFVSTVAHAQDLDRSVLLAPIGIATQVVEQPAPPPPTPRHTGIKATLRAIPRDFRHLGSRENLMWVGIGSVAALAVHPVDDNINRHFQGVGGAETFFKPGKYIGQTATLASASVAIYATGRLRDTPKVSHIGMDLIRALVVDEAITQTLKFTARRERPDGSDRHSFPSGHSSATFAVATVLERHINWRMGVPAYLFASYVAMSRLHENKHFASDVAFGAAVGIIAGRTVTEPGSDKYAFAIAPIRGGVGVQFATNFAH